MVKSEEITKFELTQTRFEDKRVVSGSEFLKNINCMVPLGANFVACKTVFLN